MRIRAGIALLLFAIAAACMVLVLEIAKVEFRMIGYASLASGVPSAYVLVKVGHKRAWEIGVLIIAALVFACFLARSEFRVASMGFWMTSGAFLGWYGGAMLARLFEKPSAGDE